MRIAPVVLNSWVAGLFVVGASLFVLGSVPPYINGVGATVDAATYALGAVFFTVSTIAALSHNLTTAQTDHRIWRPDLYGSLRFLAASAVGLLALGGALHACPRSAAWWTAWLNMGGSVAFMAAALASYVLPSTDEILNVPVAVGGTFLGAACFLVGAVLLLPAWRQRPVTV